MNAVNDKTILSPEVKAILSTIDKAVSDSNSLSDLVGKVISGALDKVIKGE